MYNENKYLKICIVFVSFVIFFIATLFIFRTFSKQYVPVNSDIFQKTNQYNIISVVYNRHIFFGEGKYAALPKRFEISGSLHFPDAIKVNETAEFRFVLESNDNLFAQGIYNLSVKSQKPIILYDELGSTDSDLKIEFFADSPNNGIAFRWFVLPESAGKFKVWISNIKVPLIPDVFDAVYFPDFNSDDPFRTKVNLSEGLRLDRDGNLSGKINSNFEVYNTVGVSEKTWSIIELTVPIIISIFLALATSPFLISYLAAA